MSNQGTTRPNYRLYHTQFCAYCHLVRRTATDLGVELELVDIQEDLEAYQSLVRRLGRGAVPVLGVVTGGAEQLLTESRKIVRHLRETHGAAEAS